MLWLGQVWATCKNSYAVPNFEHSANSPRKKTGSQTQHLLAHSGAGDLTAETAEVVHAPSAELLLAAGVEPYTDLPLWVSAPDAALFLFSNAKAVAAGLTFRMT